MDEKQKVEPGQALRIEWTGHSWSVVRDDSKGGMLAPGMKTFTTFDEAVEHIKTRFDLPSG